MKWFSNVPPLVKALAFAVVFMIVAIGSIIGILAINDWMVVSYGEHRAENVWAFVGCFLLVTGLAWLWQVLD